MSGGVCLYHPRGGAPSGSQHSLPTPAGTSQRALVRRTSHAEQWMQVQSQDPEMQGGSGEPGFPRAGVEVGGQECRSGAKGLAL